MGNPPKAAVSSGTAGNSSGDLRTAGAASQGREVSGVSSTAGGLASMLDMNGDGNPLDDIMRMAGKVRR